MNIEDIRTVEEYFKKYFWNFLIKELNSISDLDPQDYEYRGVSDEDVLEKYKFYFAAKKLRDNEENLNVSIYLIDKEALEDLQEGD